MRTGTRYFVRLEVGQVWRSSDPRRLSAFRIDYITGLDSPRRYDSVVFTSPVYPPEARSRVLKMNDFYRLGSKGFTRVS